ncbi:hypothetical protein M3Y96_00286200 [Aphelenchoides besseyi]|nr:hypothetical protein M3Y96_00286200 [Aphelenchoides besseyi]
MCTEVSRIVSARTHGCGEKAKGCGCVWRSSGCLIEKQQMGNGKMNKETVVVLKQIETFLEQLQQGN